MRQRDQTVGFKEEHGHATSDAPPGWALDNARWHPDLMRGMLDAGLPVDYIYPDTGYGHVYACVLDAAADPQALRLLIERGCDVNTCKTYNDQRVPAIAEACRGLRADLLEVLIDAGADVAAVDHAGRTALHYLTLGVFTAPEAKGLAAYAPMARRLLAAGVDVNARTLQGDTALILAARTGHTGAMEVLLGAGADPGIESAAGLTALALAEIHGHQQAARLLHAAQARSCLGAAALEQPAP